MEEEVLVDSLSISQSIVKGETVMSEETNIWFWLSIFEFVLIILLLLLKKNKKETELKKQYKKESLSNKVDFNNVIKSSFHSIELYDQLKVKCHPDRFASNPELMKKADKLFQEISGNKTNIKRLEELKLAAIKELKIKF